MGMFDKLLNDQTEAKPETEQPTDLTTLANTFVVKTDADYSKAAEFCKDIKAAIKDINDKWEPLVKKAFEAHKALKEQQNAAVKPLEAAALYLKGQMDTFFNAKEKKRLEAERKIREEQEAERRRLQEEADRVRREQEAELRRAQEAADKLAAAGRAEEAEKARVAARIAAEAREREALAAEDAAATMPVASVQSSAPKVDGVNYVTEYEAVIVDDVAVPLVFQGVALRPVDMKAVNALVKASKGKIAIPGISITEVKKSRVRA